MAVNYLKNVIKSLAFTAKDNALDLVPNIKEFTENNKEYITQTISMITSPRVQVKKVINAISNSKVFEALNYGYENFKKDLKTGKFYDKSRSEAAMMKMMGFDDFDMSGDDWNFDNFEEDINSDNDASIITEGDKMITSSIEGSVQAATSTTVNAIVTSNTASMKNARLNAGLLYQQNEKLFGSLHNDIATTNGIMKTILDFHQASLGNIDKNLATFQTESLKLDTERNEILKKQFEFFNHQAKTAKEKEEKELEESKKYKKKTLSDIAYSGLPDMGSYLENITKKVNDTFSLFTGETGLIEMFKANSLTTPIQSLIGGIMNLLTPSETKDILKSLDKTVAGIFPAFINSVNKIANNVFENPVVRTIAEWLGLDTKFRTSVDTTSYEKGKVAWDGMSRKAIMEVIPDYLSRIESALTGGDQRIYDFNNGKWTTYRIIKKEKDEFISKKLESNLYEFHGKLTDEMENLVNKKLAENRKDKNFDSIKDEKARENFYKDESMLRESLRRSYRDALKQYERYMLDRFSKGQDFIPDSINKDDLPKTKDYRSLRYKIDDINNFVKQLDPSEKLALIGDLSNTSSEIDEYMNKQAHTEYSTWRQLAAYGADAKNLKPDENLSKANLISYRDEHNHTIHSYLFNILKEIKLIRSDNLGRAIPISNNNDTQEQIISQTTATPKMTEEEAEDAIDKSGQNIVLRELAKKSGSNKKSNKRVYGVLSSDQLINQFILDYINNIATGETDLYDLKQAVEKKFPNSWWIAERYLIELSRIVRNSSKAKNELKDEYNKYFDSDRDLNFNKFSRFLNKNILDQRIKTVEHIDQAIENVSTDLNSHAGDITYKRKKTFDKKVFKVQDTFLDKIGFTSLQEGINSITKGFNANLREWVTETNEWVYKMFFNEPMRDPETGERYDSFLSMLGAKTSKLFKKFGDEITKGFRKFKEYLGIDDDDFKSRFKGSASGILSGLWNTVVNANRRVILDPATGLFMRGGTVGSDIMRHLTPGAWHRNIFRMSKEDFDNLTDEEKYYYTKTHKEMTGPQEEILLSELDDDEKHSKMQRELRIAGLDANKLIDRLNSFEKDRLTEEDIDKIYNEQINRNSKRNYVKDRLGINYTSLDSFIRKIKDYVSNTETLDNNLSTFKTDLEKEDYLLKVAIEELQKDRLMNEEKFNEIEQKLEMEKLEKESKDKVDSNAKGTYISKPFTGLTMLTRGEKVITGRGVIADVPKTGAYELVNSHVLNNRQAAAFDRAMGKTPIHDISVSQAAKEEAMAEQRIFHHDEGTFNSQQFAKFAKKSKYSDEVISIASTAKKLIPELAAGGLVGGGISLLLGLTGGPLLGAGIGAASTLVYKSEKLQNLLFGDLNKETGERKDNGFISTKIQNLVKKYAPDMIDYGIAGIISSLILPVGPIAGLAIGSGIGFLKNNEDLRNMLFGKLGLGKSKQTEIVNKFLPNTIKGAILGGVSTLFGGPFGILGNAAIGAGIGMMTSSEEFKNMILGFKGPNGDRVGGIWGAFKDLLEPLKRAFQDFSRRITTAFNNNILKPLTDFIRPAIMEIPHIAGLLPKKINEWLDKGFGIRLDNIIKRWVIEPIRKSFQPLGSLTARLFKWATSPLKVFGFFGDRLRRKQILERRATDMTAAERVDFALMNPNLGMKVDPLDQMLMTVGSDQFTLEQAQDMRESLSNLISSKHDVNVARKKTSDKIYKLLSTFTTAEGSKISPKTLDRVRKAIDSGNYDLIPKILQSNDLSGDNKFQRGLTKDELEVLESAGLKTDLATYAELNKRYNTMKGLSDEELSEQAKNAKIKLNEYFKDNGIEGIDLTNTENVNRLISLLDTEIERVNNDKAGDTIINDSIVKGTSDIVTAIHDLSKNIIEYAMDKSSVGNESQQASQLFTQGMRNASTYDKNRIIGNANILGDKVLNMDELTQSVVLQQNRINPNIRKLFSNSKIQYDSMAQQLLINYTDFDRDNVINSLNKEYIAMIESGHKLTADDINFFSQIGGNTKELNRVNLVCKRAIELGIVKNYKSVKSLYSAYLRNPNILMRSEKQESENKNTGTFMPIHHLAEGTERAIGTTAIAGAAGLYGTSLLTGKGMLELLGLGANATAGALQGGIVATGSGLSALGAGLLTTPGLVAALGAGALYVYKSKKAQEFLFGKIVNGRRTDTGLISTKIQKFFTDNVPSLTKGAILGYIGNSILPFGPVAGPMIGATLSWLESESELKNKLLGSVGLDGKQATKYLKRIKFGGLSGAILGGVLGGPFGILGNAAIGAGINLIGSSDMFKNFMFGRKDKEGKRHGGVVGNLGKGLYDSIVRPIKYAFAPLGKAIKTSVKDMITSFKDWAKKGMTKTLRWVIQRPLELIFNNVSKKLSNTVLSSLSSVFKGIGKWLFGRPDEGDQSISYNLGRIIGSPIQLATQLLFGFSGRDIERRNMYGYSTSGTASDTVYRFGINKKKAIGKDGKSKLSPEAFMYHMSEIEKNNVDNDRLNQAMGLRAALIEKQKRREEADAAIKADRDNFMDYIVKNTDEGFLHTISKAIDKPSEESRTDMMKYITKYAAENGLSDKDMKNLKKKSNEMFDKNREYRNLVNGYATSEREKYESNKSLYESFGISENAFLDNTVAAHILDTLNKSLVGHLKQEQNNIIAAETVARENSFTNSDEFKQVILDKGIKLSDTTINVLFDKYKDAANNQAEEHKILLDNIAKIIDNIKSNTQSSITDTITKNESTTQEEIDRINIESLEDKNRGTFKLLKDGTMIANFSKGSLTDAQLNEQNKQRKEEKEMSALRKMQMKVYKLLGAAFGGTDKREEDETGEKDARGRGWLGSMFTRVKKGLKGGMSWFGKLTGLFLLWKSGILGAVGKAALDLLPKVGDLFVKIAPKIGTGIASALGWLGNKTVENASGITKAVATAGGKILDYATGNRTNVGATTTMQIQKDKSEDEFSGLYAEPGKKGPLTWSQVKVYLEQDRRVFNEQGEPGTLTENGDLLFSDGSMVGSSYLMNAANGFLRALIWPKSAKKSVKVFSGITNIIGKGASYIPVIGKPLQAGIKFISSAATLPARLGTKTASFIASRTAKKATEEFTKKATGEVVEKATEEAIETTVKSGPMKKLLGMVSDLLTSIMNSGPVKYCIGTLAGFFQKVNQKWIDSTIGKFCKKLKDLIFKGATKLTSMVSSLITKVAAMLGTWYVKVIADLAIGADQAESILGVKESTWYETSVIAPITYTLCDILVVPSIIPGTASVAQLLYEHLIPEQWLNEFKQRQADADKWVAEYNVTHGTTYSKDELLERKTSFSGWAYHGTLDTASSVWDWTKSTSLGVWESIFGETVSTFIKREYPKIKWFYTGSLNDDQFLAKYNKVLLPQTIYKLKVLMDNKDLMATEIFIRACLLHGKDLSSGLSLTNNQAKQLIDSYNNTIKAFNQQNPNLSETEKEADISKLLENLENIKTIYNEDKTRLTENDYTQLGFEVGKMYNIEWRNTKNLTDRRFMLQYIINIDRAKFAEIYNRAIKLVPIFVEIFFRACLISDLNIFTGEKFSEEEYQKWRDLYNKSVLNIKYAQSEYNKEQYTIEELTKKESRVNKNRPYKQVQSLEDYRKSRMSELGDISNLTDTQKQKIELDIKKGYNEKLDKIIAENKKEELQKLKLQQQEIDKKLEEANISQGARALFNTDQQNKRAQEIRTQIKGEIKLPQKQLLTLDEYIQEQLEKNPYYKERPMFDRFGNWEKQREEFIERIQSQYLQYVKNFKIYEQELRNSEKNAGMGKYSKMIDPRIAGLQYNTAGDKGLQTIGDSGCGPAAVVNLLESYGKGKSKFGRGVYDIPMLANQYASSGAKELDGGTDPRAMAQTLQQQGFNTQITTDKSLMQKWMNAGGKAIWMGENASGTSQYDPWGQGMHYVTQTGQDAYGNPIIQDSESPFDNLSYKSNNLIKGTKLGILVDSGMGKFGRGEDTFIPKSDIERNALVIRNYLKSKGIADNAIYGILGNMQAESGINPERMEDLLRQEMIKSGKDFGIQWTNDKMADSRAYTQAINSGKISKEEFLRPSVGSAANKDKRGYGLVQFTSANLKENLYNRTVPNGISIGSLPEQLDSIMDMISSNRSYRRLANALYNSQLGVDEQTELFLREYERPSNIEGTLPKRLKFAKQWWHTLTGKPLEEMPLSNKISLTDQEKQAANNKKDEKPDSLSSIFSFITSKFQEIFNMMLGLPNNIDKSSHLNTNGEMAGSSIPANVKLGEVPKDATYVSEDGFTIVSDPRKLTKNVATVTSKFGPRKPPTPGASSFHKGVDLIPSGVNKQNRFNHPIAIAADGVVTYIGKGRGYGNFVEVSHGNGFSTRYAHLNSSDIKGVSKGQKVKGGQFLLPMGNSGIGTGAHLHFEVRRDGKAIEPFNGLLEMAKIFKANGKPKEIASVAPTNVNMPFKDAVTEKAITEEKPTTPTTTTITPSQQVEQKIAKPSTNSTTITKIEKHVSGDSDELKAIQQARRNNAKQIAQQSLNTPTNEPIVQSQTKSNLTPKQQVEQKITKPSTSTTTIIRSERHVSGDSDELKAIQQARRNSVKKIAAQQSSKASTITNTTPSQKVEQSITKPSTTVTKIEKHVSGDSDELKAIQQARRNEAKRIAAQQTVKTPTPVNNTPVVQTQTKSNLTPKQQELMQRRGNIIKQHIASGNYTVTGEGKYGRSSTMSLIGNIANMFGNMMISGKQPTAQDIISNVGSMIPGMPSQASGLLNNIGSMMNGGKPDVGGMLGSIGSMIPGMPSQATGLLNNIGSMMSGGKPDVGSMLGSIGSMIPGMPSQATGLLNNIGSMMSGGKPDVGGMINSVSGMLPGSIGNIASMFGNMMTSGKQPTPQDIMSTVGNIIPGGMPGPISNIMGNIGNMMSGGKPDVGGMLGAIGSMIPGMPSQASNIMSNIGSMMSGGRPDVGGMINAVGSMIPGGMPGNIGNIASMFGNMMTSGKQPTPQDIMSTVGSMIPGGVPAPVSNIMNMMGNMNFGRGKFDSGLLQTMGSFISNASSMSKDNMFSSIGNLIGNVLSQQAQDQQQAILQQQQQVQQTSGSIDYTTLIQEIVKLLGKVVINTDKLDTMANIFNERLGTNITPNDIALAKNESSLQDQMSKMLKANSKTKTGRGTRKVESTNQQYSANTDSGNVEEMIEMLNSIASE